MGQFDASAYDVVKRMEAAAIPDDIKTLLNDLVELAKPS